MDLPTEEQLADEYDRTHSACERCGDTVCLSESEFCCCEPAALRDEEDPGILYCSRECRRKYAIEAVTVMGVLRLMGSYEVVDGVVREVTA
jgi:hypothetical protein